MSPDVPTAEQLVAHTEWLLQLARALVGEASAPDVVQDTFEVALARPPARPGPLRPWLGGVARNVARMTVRGRVRRVRRDSAAIDPTAEVPTPDQLVERVEMQQRVARIVLELPEPLRQTLLLRFFEGMTAAEIARAQRIPAATVRGRLKDALDRVRATLDHEPGGRKRWLALLAPLPIAAPHSAAAATLAGGLIVKASVKIALAIVVIVVMVLGTRWLGWWGGGGDDRAAAADRAAADRARVPNGPTPASPAPAAARPGGRRAEIAPIHDDDPRGPLRLEGQVIDEHDAPVGGARVAIDAHPVIVVTTEEDGSFVFEGLIPRDYRLEATAGDGYAGPARLRLTDKAEPVTLRMRRGGTVEVVVTTAAGGKPIAGAEVELRSTLTWAGKTDAAGKVTLRGVGAVWAPVTARAPGYAPDAMMLSTSGDPAAPERVALALATGAAIAGRVVDDAGKPIEGARVVAVSTSEPFPVVDPRRDGVTTGANGAFRIPIVAAGTWRLTASDGDRAPASTPPITVDGVHPRDAVELVLPRGGVVRGTVRDRAGQPVAAAEVDVVVRGHLDWRMRRRAYSNGDGTFTVAGLPRRAVDVVATHDTGASAIAPVDLGARPSADVALVLDIVGTITGTVVDANGAPIGDAQVIAEPEWSGGTEDRAAWSVRGLRETVTDQGGAFRFGGLPDTSYRVRAARPGAPESALALAAGVTAKPGAAPLRLVVQDDGRIVGKVRLPDGKPPARFAVAVGGGPAIPSVAADGSFALTAPAGSHTLVISGPGFATKSVADVAVTAGKDRDLGTIDVAAGRSISGRVLDESGAPVAGAQVAGGPLLTGGGAELFIPDESPGAKSTETDADGTFTLAGFGPGALTVVAGKRDVGRSPSIRIPPGHDSATLDLALGHTTGLAGKVVRGGAPAADVVVIANPIGAIESNFFVTTGADGTFALDALAPGTYIVSPMFGGGGNRPKDMYPRRVEVTAGKRAEVVIDATPGALALTVAVKAPGGAPAPAMLIVVQAAVEPTTMDDLRDGTRLPAQDTAIPIYMRAAMGGPVEITGMNPGAHTVCALPMVRVDDPSKVPIKCAHVTLDPGRPKAKVDVVVPIPN